MPLFKKKSAAPPLHSGPKSPTRTPSSASTATPSIASTDTWDSTSTISVATPHGSGSTSSNIADSASMLTLNDGPPSPSYPPPSGPIQLSTLTTLGPTGTNENTTLISLIPPPTSQRAPIELVCVIDVSGSMDTEATIKSLDGTSTESNGLTTLDVVKHAMKTIIASLEPQDRLGIVTFSDEALVEMGVRGMDAQGKRMAEKVVEGLVTKGMTNLWDGLKSGLGEIKKGARVGGGNAGVGEGMGRVKSVFVLTDGQPNVEPPRGSVAMLKSHMDQMQTDDGPEGGKVMCTVNTFGFGYSLDSEMLHGLAVEGNGVYSFIPDAGMVGTAFINALSNILVTMAMNVTLSVEFLNGVEAVGEAKKAPKVGTAAGHRKQEEREEEGDEVFVLGGHRYTKTSWGLQIYLGTVQFSQGKDVIVNFSDMPNSEKNSSSDRPFMNLKLTYDLCSTANPTTTTQTLDDITFPTATSKDAAILISQHTNRLLAVSTISSLATANFDKTVMLGYLQTTAISPITNSPSASSGPTKALLQDLTDQATLAISEADYFSRWGQHYLLSLSRAHLLQQCNNFKDPGVQIYGGDKFRSLRDKLDGIFDNLPAPKPSVKVTNLRGRFGSYGGGGGGHLPAAPLASMSRYNQRSAPCFSGEGVVSLSPSAPESRKLVRDIKKGDVLHNGGKVKCVIVTKIKIGKEYLCVLPDSGLRVTSYHPVLYEGVWTYPCMLAQPELVDCDYVYSFLLENNNDRDGEGGVHEMVINGVTATTLGHGFVSNAQTPVRGHHFLGSYENVARALREVDERGYEEVGRVVVAGTKREFNGRGLVCGFEKVQE